jgi:endogenous inhibitor of DNA gyrase (YacG/DUF329 family)
MTQTPAKAGRCPECRAPSEPAFRPFCSKRCADLDLARWLTGGYAIPVAAIPDDSDDDTPEAGGAMA